MKKQDLDEYYPRQSSQSSAYQTFQHQQGLGQQNPSREPSQRLPLAQAAQMRLPNTNDWSKDQEKIWSSKDPVEIERYYLNTHHNIKKMKKSPRGKPTCLIQKKKEWRTGLASILVTTVDGWQPIHRSRTVRKTAARENGTLCNKKETTIMTSSVRQPTPSSPPSFQIDEETEEDTLLNND